MEVKNQTLEELFEEVLGIKPATAISNVHVVQNIVPYLFLKFHKEFGKQSEIGEYNNRLIFKVDPLRSEIETGYFACNKWLPGDEDPSLCYNLNFYPMHPKLWMSGEAPMSITAGYFYNNKGSISAAYLDEQVRKEEVYPEVRVVIPNLTGSFNSHLQRFNERDVFLAGIFKDLFPLIENWYKELSKNFDPKTSPLY